MRCPNCGESKYLRIDNDTEEFFCEGCKWDQKEEAEKD